MALIIGGKKEAEHASLAFTTVASGNILTAYCFDCERLVTAQRQGSGSFTTTQVGNFEISATYGSGWSVSVKSLDGKTYTLQKGDGTIIGTFNSTPVSFINNNTTIYCFGI